MARPGVAAQFFAALATDPPGVRAALQEALGALAGAYAGCKGASICLLPEHLQAAEEKCARSL